MATGRSLWQILLWGLRLIGVAIDIVAFFGFATDWRAANEWLTGLTEPQFRVLLVVVGTGLILLTLPWSRWFATRSGEKDGGGGALATAGSAAAVVRDSPGSTIKQFVFGRDPKRPESPVVRPAEEYCHEDHWEVLEDLPRGHRELLYSILDRGKRRLDYTAELAVLVQHGLAEQRIQVDRYSGVFRIPESLCDLVEAFREEENREKIRKALKQAEEDESFSLLLRLFTADKIPERVPQALFETAQQWRYGWLLQGDYDAERQQFVYSLTPELTAFLGGELWGDRLRREELVMKTADIEGYDPEAPVYDYSGRGMPFVPGARRPPGVGENR
jgi:hypothetical protein